MPSRVLAAMQQPAPNIYAGPLLDLTAETYAGLTRLAKSSGQLISYVGNGHAAWEACLSNTLNPGDKVVALVNGRFGGAWAKIAESMGVEVSWIRSAGAEPVDLAQLKIELDSDSAQTIKAVLMVQTDTSTSIINDVKAARQVIDGTGHSALFLVDGIASLACEPFYMDDWGVDVLVAACQKGLMTPPGLAFNFLSQKAWVNHSKIKNPSPYWNWQPRLDGKLFPEKFGGTPPTHLLLGLHEAVKMLEEEGIENTWQRHRQHAQCVWAAIGQWSNQGNIRQFIADEALRSTAVTTLLSDDAERIQNWTQVNTGVTLGVGLHANVDDGVANNQFRIGHMGHLSPPMILGTLSSINSALIALDIEHGSGALDAACGVIAGQ